jgi:hypothetical protein
MSSAGTATARVGRGAGPIATPRMPLTLGARRTASSNGGTGGGARPPSPAARTPSGRTSSVQGRKTSAAPANVVELAAKPKSEPRVLGRPSQRLAEKQAAQPPKHADPNATAEANGEPKKVLSKTAPSIILRLSATALSKALAKGDPLSKSPRPTVAAAQRSASTGSAANGGAKKAAGTSTTTAPRTPGANEASRASVSSTVARTPSSTIQRPVSPSARAGLPGTRPRESPATRPVLHRRPLSAGTRPVVDVAATVRRCVDEATAAGGPHSKASSVERARAVSRDPAKPDADETVGSARERALLYQKSRRLSGGPTPVGTTTKPQLAGRTSRASSGGPSAVAMQRVASTEPRSPAARPKTPLSGRAALKDSAMRASAPTPILGLKPTPSSHVPKVRRVVGSAAGAKADQPRTSAYARQQSSHSSKLADAPSPHTDAPGAPTNGTVQVAPDTPAATAASERPPSQTLESAEELEDHADVSAPLGAWSREGTPANEGLGSSLPEPRPVSPDPAATG